MIPADKLFTRIDCEPCDGTGNLVDIGECFVTFGGNGAYVHKCDGCSGRGWYEGPAQCDECDAELDARGYCHSCEEFAPGYPVEGEKA